MSVEQFHRAIERRVQRAMDNEDDDLNLDQSVISARDNLKRARNTPGPTKILDVVAADGSVRQAIREIIVNRIVEVAG